MMPSHRFPAVRSIREIVMPWLRIPALAAVLAFSVLLPAPPAWAERQCNVPAGYYRLVDKEDDGAIEFRQMPSHRSKLLAALSAGEIVQSDGSRSPDENNTVTTW